LLYGRNSSYLLNITAISCITLQYTYMTIQHTDEVLHHENTYL
jgi:hypothetical protein